AICHVEASWAHPDGTPFTTKLEIAGTKGLYMPDNQSIIPLAIRRTVDGQHVYQPENPQPRDPYALELEHFFDCLEKGTQPLTHGREAAKTLAICLAANESAKTGQVVTLGGASSWNLASSALRTCTPTATPGLWARSPVSRWW